MNFNKCDDILPFNFSSLIYFVDDEIKYSIGLSFNDDIDNKFMIEGFSDTFYNRWTINHASKNIMFNCDLVSSYFFRIQCLDGDSNNIYYGFYQFDIDSIPNKIKNYFLETSKIYRDGLTLFIKENISKYNYKDFKNNQYNFISNTIDDTSNIIDLNNNSKKESVIKSLYSDESDDDDYVNKLNSDDTSQSVEISDRGESDVEDNGDL